MSEAPENNGATVLPGFVRLADFVKSNPHLFGTTRALQKFTNTHRDELLRRDAVARLGSGKTAPMLVHPERLQEYLRESAEKRHEQ